MKQCPYCGMIYSSDLNHCPSCTSEGSNKDPVIELRPISQYHKKKQSVELSQISIAIIVFSIFVLFLSWIHVQVSVLGYSSGGDASGLTVLNGVTENGQDVSVGGTQIGIVLFLIGAIFTFINQKIGLGIQAFGLIVFPLGWPSNTVFVSASVGTGYLIAWVIVIGAAVFVFREEFR